MLAWEPPHRFAVSWKPNTSTPYPPTEVEVQFEPTEAGTRVTLEHRGREVYGDLAAEMRTDYEVGWPEVLAKYAERS